MKHNRPKPNYAYVYVVIKINFFMNCGIPYSIDSILSMRTVKTLAEKNFGEFGTNYSR